MAKANSKELLQSKLKDELIDLILEKEREINRLTAIITKTMGDNVKLADELLLSKPKQKNPRKEKYNQGWSWVKKIEFILQAENRPLTSTEMIELFDELDEGLQFANNKQKYFSAFLSKAVRYGRVVKERRKGDVGAVYSLAK